jgi:hypothetical protein
VELGMVLPLQLSWYFSSYWLLSLAHLFGNSKLLQKDYLD